MKPYSDFPSPGSENYPAAYWFWHRLPSNAEIEAQLGQIAEAGYKTFLIQARLSFPQKEYLSEDFLLAYRKAMQRAKQLGLTAGLYDDFNWISGHAGGRTVHGSDHLRERHLFWSSSTIEGHQGHCTVSHMRSMLIEGMGPAGLEWVYEGGNIEWADWQLLKVWAYPQDHAIEDLNQISDVTEYCHIDEEGSESCAIKLKLPRAFPSRFRMTAFVSARCVSSRLINYLNPEAVRRFIDVGYEPYRSPLSEYFGDPLALLFFDHPYSGFYSWKEHEGKVLNSLMFDESLISTFSEAHGYPLDEALLGLVLPKTKTAPRWLCDLFDSYGQLGRQSYFQPITAWCRQNGLALAGHELLSFIGGWGFADGFQGIDSRCNFGADYFAIDAYKDISTVDASNSQPQISAKIGASVAKAHGRKGCMIEQYYVSEHPNTHWAAGQWDLTLDDLRSQAIRHHLFGARQFIFHAFYQTDGVGEEPSPFINPRIDFPPGINYEPWFFLHSDFSDEIARLSAFMSAGASMNDLAVLYPLRTFWAEGNDHAFANDSAFWNRWLSEQGYGFDILDESQIFEGVIANGKLEAGLGKYQCIILPGVSTVKSDETINKLGAFVEAGGTLIASSLLPNASQKDGLNPRLQTYVEDLFRSFANAVYLPVVNEHSEAFLELFRFVRRDVSELPVIHHNGEQARPIWQWYGSSETDRLAALFNDSTEQRRVTISVPQPDLTARIWQPSTGENFEWFWHGWHAGESNVYLQMGPKELVCLQLSKSVSERKPRLIDCSQKFLAAAITDEKDLCITFASYHNTTAQLTVASNQPPVSHDSRTDFNVQKTGDFWSVSIGVTNLPQSITLASNWFFRPQGGHRKTNIEMERGWESQGYQELSGIGIYETEFDLPPNFDDWDWELKFPQVKTTSEVILNGHRIGVRGWPPYSFLLPNSSLRGLANRLEVRVANTAGNFYYNNPPFDGVRLIPSGLIGAPHLVPFAKIQVLAR